MGLFDGLADAVEMDVEETLSKAVPKLAKDPEACIIVTNCGKYVGILTDRSIERTTDDASAVKLGAVVEHAPVIDSGASLPSVCEAFFSGSFKGLPVREGKAIVGVLGRRAVLRELLASGSLSGTVGEHMTSPAITADGAISIASARVKMRDSGVRRLVVTKDGSVSGIVSNFDLKFASLAPKERTPFAKEKHSEQEAPVSAFMIGKDEMAFAKRDDRLADAVKAMVGKGVSALVIEEKGRPLGLLSARDVFESVLSTAKVPVHISGLGREEKLMLYDITSTVDRELEKIARSAGVEYLSLHFKKYGHKYSIHARLKAGSGMVTVSNSGFDLGGVVHGVMDELKSISLGKLKGKAAAARKARPRLGG